MGVGSSGSAVDKVSRGSLLPTSSTKSTASSNNVGGSSTQGVPDNYYLKTTVELGLIGLWLLVLLLGGLFSGMRRASLGLPGRDGATAAGVSAMVVAAATASLVATYFELFPMDLFFWLLVGVVSATAAVEQPDAPEPKLLDRPTAI